MAKLERVKRFLMEKEKHKERNTKENGHEIHFETTEDR